MIFTCLAKARQIPAENSIQNDKVICLECGAEMKQLHGEGSRFPWLEAGRVHVTNILIAQPTLRVHLPILPVNEGLHEKRS
jgi:hypothetical protein